MDIIKSIEHEQLKNEIPVLKIGDTVRVHARIKEGNRQRIQVFEGIIIKKQGGGVNETFTVRRISYGVGVEKTFLVHSPNVEKIEVVRVGKARRAKLYYLRDRVGKAAKTKEKVGARIETLMKTIKEEVVPGESEPVEEVTELATPAEEEVVPGENDVVEEVVPMTEEEVKESKAEDAKVEAKAEAEEEVAEEVKEEAPAAEEVAEEVKEEAEVAEEATEEAEEEDPDKKSE